MRLASKTPLLLERPVLVGLNLQAVVLGVITLMDASESPPRHAAVSSPPGSSP